MSRNTWTTVGAVCWMVLSSGCGEYRGSWDTDSETLTATSTGTGTADTSDTGTGTGTGLADTSDASTGTGTGTDISSEGTGDTGETGGSSTADETDTSTPTETGDTSTGSDTGPSDTETTDTDSADTGTGTGVGDTDDTGTGTGTGSADTDSETDCPLECPIGCDPGGACLLCPGEMWNDHCYWYVATLRTRQDADNDCAVGGGHVVSINDAAENTYVASLISADSWISPYDPATEVLAVKDNDTCESAQHVPAAGGTYTGNTSRGYADDSQPGCVLARDDSADAFFAFDVATRSPYFFGTYGSGIDTIVSVFLRESGSGATGCLGEELACDDDYFSINREAGVGLLLEPGAYVAVVDGWGKGAFRFDLRRFVDRNGGELLWTNWAAEEPNNRDNDEDCAELMLSSGLWNDQGCLLSRAYVCEASR